MLRIGVIGQSGTLTPEAAEMAREVGTEIARHGAVLLTGGTNGVMEAASRGAKETGGLVVGILPGDDIGRANEYVDIPITTGFGFDMRSMVLIHSSDAIVMVGGGIGTLVELTSAYMLHKPVVVVQATGGWSDRIHEIAYEGAFLDHRRDNYPGQVDYASDAQEALQLVMMRLEGSKAMVSRSRPNDFSSKIDG